MPLKLEAERKTEIIDELMRFFATQFDEELSEFRASELVDFMLKQIGPSQYNQGIEDAAAFLMLKLEDMDAELHQEEV